MIRLNVEIRLGKVKTLKRVAYYFDKKHFGNSVSIYDNNEWYFIIKDREHYSFSVLTKDRKNYYNIDLVLV